MPTAPRPTAPEAPPTPALLPAAPPALPPLAPDAPPLLAPVPARPAAPPTAAPPSGDMDERAFEPHATPHNAGSSRSTTRPARRMTSSRCILRNERLISLHIL